MAETALTAKAMSGGDGIFGLVSILSGPCLTRASKASRCSANVAKAVLRLFSSSARGSREAIERHQKPCTRAVSLLMHDNKLVKPQLTFRCRALEEREPSISFVAGFA
jgi:hypothetical protein